MKKAELFFYEETEEASNVCGCDNQFCTLPVDKMHIGSRIEKDKKPISELCETVCGEVPFILEVTG